MRVILPGSRRMALPAAVPVTLTAAERKTLKKRTGRRA
jgi:hypothetical protein